jgi:UPF0755 protein
MAKRLPGKSTRSPVRKSKKTGTRYRFWAVVTVFGLLCCAVLFWAFSGITHFRSSKVYYYNPFPASAEAFADSLKSKGYIRSSLPLQWGLHYQNITLLKPGLYVIEHGRNGFGLAASIQRKGVKDYVEIEIDRLKNRNNVLPSLEKQTGISQRKLKELLRDRNFLDSLGELNKENAWTMFIPGVYRFPRNFTERELLENIYDAHLFYWNDEKRALAKTAGLSPDEAMILASIVYAETKDVNEMPLIAGVYLNRLHKNMRLQADPTALYAANSMQANRVREKHLKVRSKYNTYVYKGLPPGPICIPSQEALNAVLHYDEHDYIYFCAKDDFSGCHNFAEDFDGHKSNADKLRKALDKRKVH